MKKQKFKIEQVISIKIPESHKSNHYVFCENSKVFLFENIDSWGNWDDMKKWVDVLIPQRHVVVWQPAMKRHYYRGVLTNVPNMEISSDPKFRCNAGSGFWRSVLKEVQITKGDLMEMLI